MNEPINKKLLHIMRACGADLLIDNVVFINIIDFCLLVSPPKASLIALFRRSCCYFKVFRKVAASA